MRCHHHFRQSEQWTVGARLGREHVQSRAAYVTAGDGFGQRCLGDQSAAGRVNDDDTRLGLGQCLLAEAARLVGGLDDPRRGYFARKLLPAPSLERMYSDETMGQRIDDFSDCLIPNENTIVEY